MYKALPASTKMSATTVCDGDRPILRQYLYFCTAFCVSICTFVPVKASKPTTCDGDSPKSSSFCITTFVSFEAVWYRLRLSARVRESVRRIGTTVATSGITSPNA